MGWKRTIPAGVMDSALASLATFAVGLYAVRALDPVALGAYALVFSAFVTLMEVSARLIFLPAEIDAAKRPSDQRLGSLAQSIRQGSLLAVAAGLPVAAVPLAIPREAEPDIVQALTLTAIACTVVSPVQDHIRRMLHIGDHSWSAAAVSAVQVATASAALAGLTLAGVPAGWQPFGALATANLVSGAVGLFLGLRAAGGRPEHTPGLAQLVRSGRWLLLGAVAPNLSGFGVASLVAHLVSAQTLGFAEAARILARPIAMLSQGIKSVLGPGLLRAGAQRDPAAARRLSRNYAALIGVSGVLYVVVAGLDWPWNPLAALMPTAYAVPGLAAFTIGVFIIERVAGAGAGLQLLGAGRERTLAIAEVVASVGRVAAGATAPLTGAFAVPIGYLVMSAIRRSWLRLLLRRLYAGATPAVEPAP